MERGLVHTKGTVRKKPVSLGLGFATDELSYQLDIGLPQPRRTVFHRDPEIKREVVWVGPVLRPSAILIDRSRNRVRYTDDAGPRELTWALGPRLSVLDELTDPLAFPEVSGLRRMVRAWRFYDEFRTDAASPARQPQVATFTPALAGDGSDLAPALQTTLESGWAPDLEACIEDAFPGSSLAIEDAAGRMLVGLTQPGMLRTMLAPELSDGTLRYLMLAAALFAERPPTLMVLNEPETSLHPQLLPALGRLIVRASSRCQVVVVTHAKRLVRALEEGGALRHELVKPAGRTFVEGQGLLSVPRWEWAAR